VKAVEYFCFHFFKVFPLLQNFNCFHILVPCFMKNVSASNSSKSQMFPSLFPHPASFFKMHPLSQKFNCFQLPLPHPCPLFYEKCFHFKLLKKLNAFEFASLPASFFKVLPLPQKFYRFYLLLSHPLIEHTHSIRFSSI